jgi:hypothetical protein
MSFVNDLCYYSDHRVTCQDKWYGRLDEDRMIAFALFDGYNEVQVDFIWEVCPTCEGKGSHVNPSIDAHGLTAVDFYEDPDFAESYFRGDYDQPCNECGGRRVVPQPADEKYRKEIEDYRISMAEYRAEQLAERRMGA